MPKLALILLWHVAPLAATAQPGTPTVDVRQRPPGIPDLTRSWRVHDGGNSLASIVNEIIPGSRLVADEMRSAPALHHLLSDMAVILPDQSHERPEACAGQVETEVCGVLAAAPVLIHRASGIFSV